MARCYFYTQRRIIMPKAKYVKRKDGRYFTTISTGEIDEETGKEVRIPVYGRSIPEFEKNKDAIKAMMQNDTYAYDKGTTFAKYKWHWFNTYVDSTELSYNRKQSYKNLVKNHTKKLDSLALGNIKKSNIQEGYNDLNGHPDLQHEFKITVNQIFECAIEDRLIARNPAKNITITKSKRDKTKNRALSKLERAAIAKADFTTMEMCFVYMLHYCGLRRGEILALTRTDIDIANGLVDINKAVEFQGERPNIKDPKSFKGERTVDILSPLRPVLEKYLKESKTMILFANNQGTIMSRTQYRRFFQSIKLKINTAAGGTHHWDSQKKNYVIDLDLCPNLSAKAFRHEYATILYYSGIDLLEAIRLFGHEDSRTMTDIYTELRKEESKSKTKLDEYLTKTYL